MTPAKVVGPGEVVILMVHGNLFFAAAATLEAQLPAVDASTRGSVVILRLRGQDSVGGTTLHAMRRYAESLADTDSRLLLEGVGPNLYHQLMDTHTLDAVGFLEPRLARPRILDALAASRSDAAEWVASPPIQLVGRSAVGSGGGGECEQVAVRSIDHRVVQPVRIDDVSEEAVDLERDRAVQGRRTRRAGPTGSRRARPRRTGRWPTAPRSPARLRRRTRRGRSGPS